MLGSMVNKPMCMRAGWPFHERPLNTLISPPSVFTSTSDFFIRNGTLSCQPPPPPGTSHSCQSAVTTVALNTKISSSRPFAYFHVSISLSLSLEEDGSAEMYSGRAGFKKSNAMNVDKARVMHAAQRGSRGELRWRGGALMRTSCKRSARKIRIITGTA